MTKAEFVDVVAAKAGVSKKDTKAVIGAALEAIQEQLRDGNKVPLIGFGTFKVTERKARTGRNPRTGAQIKIAAAKVPAFKVSPAFKKFVNPVAAKPAKKVRKGKK